MALAELLAVGDYGRQYRQLFWMKSDRRSHSEILVDRPNPIYARGKYIPVALI
jgi:hypothetical protein